MTVTLPRVNPGDQITADDFNRLASAIERVSKIRLGSMHGFNTDAGISVASPQMPVMTIIDLDEDIEADETDKTGSAVRYDTGSNVWVDTGRNETRITDSRSSVHLTGERHAAMWMPETGRFVLWPGVQWHLVKLDAELTEGSTATASVWHVAASGSEADTGINITVRDWMLGSGETVAAGIKGVAIQHAESLLWYLISAECP